MNPRFINWTAEPDKKQVSMTPFFPVLLVLILLISHQYQLIRKPDNLYKLLATGFVDKESQLRAFAQQNAFYSKTCVEIKLVRKIH